MHSFFSFNRELPTAAREKARPTLRLRSPKESMLNRYSSFRIIKAKRSIQSNEDKTSTQGKLQIAGSLFSSNITEAAGKKDEGDDKKDAKSTSGSLFNFSNQATAGAGGLFPNTSGASLFGGTSMFKFQPAATTAAGASSVFSGGSLFGAGAAG